MRLTLLVCFMALTVLATGFKVKPIVAVKLLKIPFFLPVPKVEVDVLGAVNHVVGAKAALLGNTLRAKANILHKIADVKGGLGTLLTSLAPKRPIISIAANPVVYSPASIPETISTYTAPSTSYGPPSSVAAPYSAPSPLPPSTSYGVPASAPYP